MISILRREAWIAFVADLRNDADIRIMSKNLPFRYVSDESRDG